MKRIERQINWHLAEGRWIRQIIEGVAMTVDGFFRAWYISRGGCLSCEGGKAVFQGMCEVCLGDHDSIADQVWELQHPQ